MPITNSKVVVFNDFVELYEYSKAIMYGVSCPKPVVSRPRLVTRQFRADSIYGTRKRLRRLLLSNLGSWVDSSGRPYLPIFITFTFRDNVTDLDYANVLFKAFIRRFTAFLGFKVLYCAVPEFQQRGAVHYHVVFFNLPFIPRVYDVVSSVWGLGYTLVESVHDTLGVVGYMSKYLTKQVADMRFFGRKKYFASRGLKKPIVYRDEGVCAVIKGMTDSLTPVYKSVYQFEEFGQEILSTFYKVPGIFGLVNGFLVE